MMSVEECEEHIRFIREEKCLDKPPNSVTEDLESSLEMQLYTTSTHFLLELIQNADDNTYPEDVEPHLTFCYSNNGYLWIGCNEVGFSRANVEAICRISRSTKKSNKGAGGYIGEKGIGFKSVFKVANEVYIKSGNYSFKFDKTKTLGMIAPIVCQFPESPHVMDNTVSCLKLADGSSSKVIQEQLQQLQPSMLIFLRRLTRMSVIELYGQNGEVRSHRQLQRTGDQTESNEMTIHTVTASTLNCVTNTLVSSARYMVTEYKSENMPIEEKRAGITESSITLAFPVTDTLEAAPSNQDVYAFLPIRSFGFKFLVQADFLLVASREDIDTSLSWNQSIRDRIVDAFVKAIFVLNHTNLRYTWPGYLPQVGQQQGTFFGSVAKQLMNRLKSTPVLETYAGSFDAPSAITYLPESYTGPNGAPLLNVGRGLSAHLHPGYGMEYAALLGVLTMEPEPFVQQLKAYASKSPTDFQAQHPTWHSRLALAIITNMSTNHSLKEKLQKIVLIPLRDGTWSAANKRTLYFPSSSANSAPVPDGINMLTIPSTAAQDANRRRLFAWLGAKDLSPQEVRLRIVGEHNKASQPTWSMDVLLSHARYVFQETLHAGLNVSCVLFVATKGSGTPKRSSEVYMDEPGPALPISRYFVSNPSIANFIHPSYLEQYQGESGLYPKWVDWLKKNLGVSTQPRAFLPGAKAITPEFNHILLHCSTHVALTCIRDNWGRFGLKNDNLQSPVVQTVRARLSSMLVSCKGTHDKVKLCDTILPHLHNASPLVKVAGLKFLDIPDEQNEHWLEFRKLGVVTEDDVGLRIRLLAGLQRGKCLPTKAEIIQLYQEIQIRCKEQSAQANLKSYFQSQPVVYLPSRKAWVKMEQCVWDAPKCLRKVIPISRDYRDLRDFFTKTLDLRNASVKEIFTELLELQKQTEQTSLIKEMLLELSQEMRISRERYDPTPLRTAYVFPVKTEKGKTVRSSLMDTHDSTWYIPDRESLRMAFAPHVPLLDFTLAEQKTLEPLLKRLNLEHRKLSDPAHYMEERIINGSASLDREYTAKYREKAPYLIALVDEAFQDRERRLIEGLEVYSVASITLRRSLRLSNNKQIHANDATGGVLVASGLRIHMSSSNLRGKEAEAMYELNEEICKYCNIPEKYRDLAGTVLREDSVEVIEKILDSKGLYFVKRKLPPVVSVNSDSSVAMPPPPPSANVLRKTVSNQSQASTAMTPTSPPPVTDSSEAPSERSSSPATSESPSDPPPTVRKVQLPARKPVVLETHNELSEIQKLQKHFDRLGRLDPTTEDRQEVRVKSSRSGPARSIALERSTSASYDDPILKPSVLEDLVLRGPVRSSAPEVTRPIPAKRAKSAISPAIIKANVTGAELAGEDPEAIRIGEEGEYLVYRKLLDVLGDDFDEEIWTSETRSKYTTVPLGGFEGDHADFTFTDTSGSFTSFIAGTNKANRIASKWEDCRVTYHVEVKSTNGELKEGFNMSQNQVDMARRWQIRDEEAPEHVYLIMRVCNLDDDPQFCVYLDPWRMLVSGKMLFLSPGGYKVFKI